MLSEEGAISVNDWADNAFLLANDTENHNVLLVTNYQAEVVSTLEKRAGKYNLYSTTLVLDNPESFYGDEDNLGVFPKWLKDHQGKKPAMLIVQLKSDIDPAIVLENFNPFSDAN